MIGEDADAAIAALEPMTKIAISIALAYLLSGISQVTEDLAAEPTSRPPWARRPTFGKTIFVGATWFARPFLDAIHSNQIARGIAFGLLTVTLHLAFFTGFIWCCITTSVYLFDNAVLQVVATVTLLAVGARIVMPLLGILIGPLTLMSPSGIKIPRL
jgi:hypothetical protein